MDPPGTDQLVEWFDMTSGPFATESDATQPPGGLRLVRGTNVYVYTCLHVCVCAHTYGGARALVHCCLGAPPIALITLPVVS